MIDEARQSGVRHRLADRLFHWVMALSVIGLGITAFFPILGWKFEWVPWHWVLGVVLSVSVLFHLYRVLVVHGLSGMLPGAGDARELLGGTDLPPAKYDVFQKLYHWTAAAAVLAMVVTGILMLFKIDTTFWKRDPAIMTDQSWGWVYVIHGGAAMFLIFLFILHVYFNLRPEHRDLLVSMLKGPGPDNAREGRH